MLRTTSLCCVLVPALALAAAPGLKLFTDKGSTYFRTDQKKALVVGAELDVSTDAEGAKRVGKAVIMEVNGMLARVSLDDDATKGGGKFVHLAAAAPAPAGARPPPGAARAAAPPAASPAGPPAAPPGPTLQGRLSSGALRVTVANDSDQDWTACVLKYSDGTSYTLGDLKRRSEDGVMKVKFGFPPAPPTPLYDHLLVRCAEGESKFFFDRPNAPEGRLKGHAIAEKNGSVVVHNDSDVDWSTCDVRKPDGSHYVLDGLKARDRDGINAGRFKKEPEPKKDLFLDLVCREGSLRVKAN